MTKNISVAILVADGFEHSELFKPKHALEREGATTYIISPQKDKVRSWNLKDWGEEIDVDVALENANSRDYDALLLPGGVINPDTLRLHVLAIAFIKEFVEAKKPIAAICHGPWTLIDAGGVMHRTMTSWPSLKVDLINAGANWQDKKVIRDENLVTSRKPEDLSEFIEEMIKLFFGR